MMVRVLVHLILTVLLTETFTSLSSAGLDPASLCPPQWLPFGPRCFAFYPVWSSWSTANSTCSQTGGNLVSLHIPEERQFMGQLVNMDTRVWLGGYQAQQNGSWLWSDNSTFGISGWTNQGKGNTTEDRVCMEMDPKSGELHSAPCGELRFYICSIKASSSATVFPSRRKLVEPGLVPGVSLLDVVWGYSNWLAEEILRSSTFLRGLRSGRLTERCYTGFIQQELLYLHRVSSTVEALISRLQEADDMRSLLLDALKHYRSRNQSLPPPLPQQWLHLSLGSFHSVVLEEPVYWLVALSARACLRSFLGRELRLDKLRPGYQPVPGSVAHSLYQEWSKDNLKDVAWTHSFTSVLEEYRNKTDVFKAIGIFREHMLNQKSFYKAVDCDVEDDG
ncbi:uncharacterized protein LOC120797540 [Xiphias gladius]|uniref:uncharacterized protein LOC120797540 n=1 Tax=Xiphias gladius TaxID=8245 RepID=UPI001A99DADB|nr:uncharacterized protein LOC120797540 [Xiphias gladius]XP_039997228.1 uncharacterized protein LOC120797540 [Xiphias gladius]